MSNMTENAAATEVQPEEVQAEEVQPEEVQPQEMKPQPTESGHISERSEAAAGTPPPYTGGPQTNPFA